MKGKAKLELRNKIVSELFNNVGIENTIKKKSLSYGIQLESNIYEDIRQDIFESMLSYDIDKLIDLWNNKRKVLYSHVHCKIYWAFTSKQILNSASGVTHYPNHSSASKILYASNFRSPLDSDDSYKVDIKRNDYGVQFDSLPELIEQSFEYYTKDNIDEDSDIWKAIRSDLSRTELRLLDRYLSGKKSSKKVYRESIYNLKERIKLIVEDKNIKIHGRNGKNTTD